MKAKIKATLITIALLVLFILTGLAVFIYPDVSVIILIGASSIVTVVATWKLVYIFIDKD